MTPKEFYAALAKVEDPYILQLKGGVMVTGIDGVAAKVLLYIRELMPNASIAEIEYVLDTALMWLLLLASAHRADEPPADQQPKTDVPKGES